MLTDTHAHLNFQAFKNDFAEVLKRAQNEGVEKIINVGANFASSQKAVEIAQKYEACFASIGIHPHHAEKQNEVEKRLERLAQSPKVVAIGETGLDYHPYENGGITDPQKQKELFLAQIKLAQKLRLPIIFHCRNAHVDTLEILKTSTMQSAPSTIRGVFHCFSGDREFLEAVLKMGFYVGFDGNITYKNAQILRQRVEETPLERLLLETDCPYLTPEPLRGLRNEPANVKIIASAVAKIKKLQVTEVIKVTTQNAVNLFSL